MQIMCYVCSCCACWAVCCVCYVLLLCMLCFFTWVSSSSPSSHSYRHHQPHGHESSTYVHSCLARAHCWFLFMILGKHGSQQVELEQVELQQVELQQVELTGFQRTEAAGFQPMLCCVRVSGLGQERLPTRLVPSPSF